MPRSRSQLCSTVVAAFFCSNFDEYYSSAICVQKKKTLLEFFKYSCLNMNSLPQFMWIHSDSAAGDEVQHVPHAKRMHVI